MVFITGATGYLGTRLAEELLERGHAVKGLGRKHSIERLPAKCVPVIGDALEGSSYQNAIAPADTLVHLVGTPKPAPWKERQFRAVDKPSLQAAIAAAKHAGVRHFVYVSVAHPAPVMKSYIRVRQECEAELTASGLNSTILRPWYVLGPGHWWPLAIVPIYKILEAVPATHRDALRLGLVSWHQMVHALVWAVENMAGGVQVLDVPKIREVASRS